MRAIILAAGFARRMRPLSTSRHKTLLEVDGKAILGRIIEALAANSISDLSIVTGYRAEELEAFVKEAFPGTDVHFVHNPDYETTNNIYSLALALEASDCDQDILLIESDLIFDPSVISRIIKSPHSNVALVDKYRLGMDGTVVTLSSSGVVTQVIPSALQDDRFDFSDKYKTLNIYKFSSEFCRSKFKALLSYYASAIDHNCYYELILGILIYMQQIEVYAEVLDGEQWAELDDPNDLRVAEFTFAPHKRRNLLDNAWGGYWSTPVTDFAFIRNMYFPTPSMISELRSSLPDLLVNYSSSQSLVDEKLAYFLLCEPNNVHALNGASQLFPWLARRFHEAGVLLPGPTFGEYDRVFPAARRYPDPVAHDGDEPAVQMVERMLADESLVVFVNPNNPTGSTMHTDDIATFARRHPNATVLVDESFIEFSGEASLLATTNAGGYDNVIVLKSLSKSLGVPGLRLGYVHSTCRETMASIAAELPIWNINSVAEYYLESLLKRRPQLEASFALTRRDRDWLAERVAHVPFVTRVYPSGANFILVRTALTSEMSAAIRDELLEHKRVYLKDVSHKFQDNHVYWRIAVRLPGENEELCGLLEGMANRLVTGDRASRRTGAQDGVRLGRMGGPGPHDLPVAATTV
jgi:histidinol-phosphate/aromatic aminotransferase/cobyric acid decarboxylase-like protein/choline kinase